MKYISVLFATAMIIGLVSCEKTEDTTEPVASFKVSPSQGSVSTIFSFDASDSYDLSDSPENLLIRWDWDGDMVFDTEFSSTKVREHRFDHPGSHKVVMEISNSDGWSNRQNTIIEISADSIPPQASFSVIPDTSSVGTIFHFCAAASTSNLQTPFTALQFRWDWNNDGVWDTPYMPGTSIYHKYTEFGNFRILLEVKNSVALTDTTSRKIFVYDI